MFSNKKIKSEPEKEFLDKHMSDIIETDPNCMISWYILAMYAKLEKEEDILSDEALSLISRRICRDWDSLNHRYKDHLTVDMVRKLEYNGEYPKQIDQAFKQMITL